MRHLAYKALGGRIDRPEPIVVTVPTIGQRLDYEAYAAAKGRPSVEAWAAEAIATERNRTHLTTRQVDVYGAVLEKLVGPSKAVQLEAIAEVLTMLV